MLSYSAVQSGAKLVLVKHSMSLRYGSPTLPIVRETVFPHEIMDMIFNYAAKDDDASCRHLSVLCRINKSFKENFTLLLYGRAVDIFKLPEEKPFLGHLALHQLKLYRATLCQFVDAGGSLRDHIEDKLYNAGKPVPNVTGRHACTALIHAAVHGFGNQTSGEITLASRKEDISLVLECGANINRNDCARNEDACRHKTALIQCLEFKYGAKQHRSAVYLISRGADVTARSSTGGTALHYHIENLRGTEADACMMSFLINCGADVNAQNEWGQTPLLCLLEPQSANPKHDEESGHVMRLARDSWYLPFFIKFLIDHGANVGHRYADCSNLGGWNAWKLLYRTKKAYPDKKIWKKCVELIRKAMVEQGYGLNSPKWHLGV